MAEPLYDIPFMAGNAICNNDGHGVYVISKYGISSVTFLYGDPAISDPELTFEYSQDGTCVNIRPSYATALYGVHKIYIQVVTSGSSDYGVLGYTKIFSFWHSNVNIIGSVSRVVPEGYGRSAYGYRLMYSFPEDSSSSLYSSGPYHLFTEEYWDESSGGTYYWDEDSAEDDVDTRNTLIEYLPPGVIKYNHLNGDTVVSGSLGIFTSGNGYFWCVRESNYTETQVLLCLKNTTSVPKIPEYCYIKVGNWMSNYTLDTELSYKAMLNVCPYQIAVGVHNIPWVDTTTWNTYTHTFSDQGIDITLSGGVWSISGYVPIGYSIPGSETSLTLVPSTGGWTSKNSTCPVFVPPSNIQDLEYNFKTFSWSLYRWQVLPPSAVWTNNFVVSTSSSFCLNGCFYDFKGSVIYTRTSSSGDSTAVQLNMYQMKAVWRPQYAGWPQTQEFSNTSGEVLFGYSSYVFRSAETALWSMVDHSYLSHAIEVSSIDNVAIPYSPSVDYIQGQDTFYGGALLCSDTAVGFRAGDSYSGGLLLGKYGSTAVSNTLIPWFFTVREFPLYAGTSGPFIYGDIIVTEVINDFYEEFQYINDSSGWYYRDKYGHSKKTCAMHHQGNLPMERVHVPLEEYSSGAVRWDVLKPIQNIKPMIFYSQMDPGSVDFSDSTSISSKDYTHLWNDNKYHWDGSSWVKDYTDRFPLPSGMPDFDITTDMHTEGVSVAPVYSDSRGTYEALVGDSPDPCSAAAHEVSTQAKIFSAPLVRRSGQEQSCLRRTHRHRKSDYPYYPYGEYDYSDSYSETAVENSDIYFASVPYLWVDPRLLRIGTPESQYESHSLAARLFSLYYEYPIKTEYNSTWERDFTQQDTSKVILHRERYIEYRVEDGVGASGFNYYTTPHGSTNVSPPWREDKRYVSVLCVDINIPAGTYNSDDPLVPYRDVSENSRLTMNTHTAKYATVRTITYAQFEEELATLRTLAKSHRLEYSQVIDKSKNYGSGSLPGEAGLTPLASVPYAGVYFKVGSWPGEDVSYLYDPSVSTVTWGYGNPEAPNSWGSQTSDWPPAPGPDHSSSTSTSTSQSSSGSHSGSTSHSTSQSTSQSGSHSGSGGGGGGDHSSSTSGSTSESGGASEVWMLKGKGTVTIDWTEAWSGLDPKTVRIVGTLGPNMGLPGFSGTQCLYYEDGTLGQYYVTVELRFDVSGYIYIRATDAPIWPGFVDYIPIGQYSSRPADPPTSDPLDEEWSCPSHFEQTSENDHISIDISYQRPS